MKKEEYLEKFRELGLNDPQKQSYPRNDSGTHQLFYYLHRDIIVFVKETNAWFVYNGQRWVKDDGGYVFELCKEFVRAYAKYAKEVGGESLVPSGKKDEYKSFQRYIDELHSHSKRNALITAARYIAPKSIVDFDTNPLLFNCTNGTFNLESNQFRQHQADDYITKMARVEYKEGADCERWLKFIGEIMCDDEEKTRFLQKVCGYGISGLTHLECLFILYGKKTRNGKSTLTETISYLLGDYAMTMQPQTLARRNSNGSAPSPDIARLKGARFVNTPEPPKGLELDVALVKQVTGGDSVSGRLLFQNPIEFRPDFKIFINTNHLPKITDKTVFISGRIHIIPFERHFSKDEQDMSLKKEFRQMENMSGILNWLIDGYRILKEEKFDNIPEKIRAATYEYEEAIIDIDTFFNENVISAKKEKVKTFDIYQHYVNWVKEQGCHPMSIQEFVGELRSRYEITRDGKLGNIIRYFQLKK